MTTGTEGDWASAFFTHCPEPLFAADLHGALLHQNHAFRTLLGERIPVGTALVDLVHPEDRSGFAAAWSPLCGEGAAAVRLECRMRDAQGGYREVIVSGGRSGERREVYGALRVVEAGTQPAEELTRVHGERKILRLILDNLPLVVWAMDAEGVARFGDGRNPEVTGLPQGQFEGMNLLTVYADNPPVLASLRRALAGEPLHSVNEAHGRWFENWHLPIRDEQGRVVSVFVITLNVTEARRAEQELRDRLALIERQREAIRDLETPIIQVWDRVLTLPLVGVVDSRRAADVMQRLLDQIVRTGARFAILDLTGVDTMDTGTAGHLIALIRAIKLLGAEGVLTGIRPVVAQTMIALGLDFSGLVTLASLRDGLGFCMRRLGSLPKAKGDAAGAAT